MLNYIWAGLIIISLVFAFVNDVKDITQDTYRNEKPLPIALRYPNGFDPAARTQDVEILVNPAQYQQFYGNEETPDSVFKGTLVSSERGRQVRFAADASLPEPLGTIFEFSKSRDDELQGRLTNIQAAGPNLTRAGIVFDPARFVKSRAITEAALDLAETAVTLAIELIGVIALFLGLLRIAEDAGIVNALVRFTQPIFRPLFPEIPAGHPAMGLIVLNMTANMLGLGNAATPLGLKAMEELQKLNPSKDTATNSMVMLLAINTASVQLVPPTLLVAIMGLQVTELMFPIIAVTLMSAVVAVAAAKLMGRLPGYRASDPLRQAPGTLP